MATSEQTIWEESPTMRDVLFNPFMLIITVLPLGLPLLFIWLRRSLTRYTLTNERLIVRKGLFSKSVDDIELYRIRDTRAEQSFFERLVNIGRIEVSSTDETGLIVVDKVIAPHDKRESIRRLAEDAKRQRNIRIVEE